METNSLQKANTIILIDVLTVTTEETATSAVLMITSSTTAAATTAASSMVLVTVTCVAAMPPVGVVASVRGKKYDIEAETVEEFTAKVEEAAGLEPGQQSVLFRGKVLSADDDLSEIGVSDGDVLNVVKGRKQRSVATPEEIDDGLLDGSGCVI